MDKKLTELIEDKKAVYERIYYSINIKNEYIHRLYAARIYREFYAIIV